MLMTRSTSGMWNVMRTVDEARATVELALLAQVHDGLQAQLLDGPTALRRDAHRIVGAVQGAGAHPAPVRGAPTAGVADVEAAVDVEVAGALLRSSRPVPCQTRPIDDALQRLLDEQAIRRLLVDYCRGVDRGDEALVASVYHPDATDDHGRFKGTGLDFAAYAVPRLTRAVPGHDALDHQHGDRLRRR